MEIFQGKMRRNKNAKGIILLLLFQKSSPSHTPSFTSNSGWSGKDWRLANVMHIYKKSKEDPGNYKPAIMEQIILSIQHM